MRISQSPLLSLSPNQKFLRKKHRLANRTTFTSG